MWWNEYEMNIKCDEMCQNLSSLHGVQTTKFRPVPRAIRGPPLVGHFVKGQIRRRAGFEQRSGKEHPWTSLGCRCLRTGQGALAGGGCLCGLCWKIGLTLSFPKSDVCGQYGAPRVAFHWLVILWHLTSEMEVSWGIPIVDVLYMGTSF